MRTGMKGQAESTAEDSSENGSKDPQNFCLQ